MVDKINKPKDVQTPLVQPNGNNSVKEQSKKSTFGFGFNAADLDMGVSVEKRDVIQNYTPKEKIEKQRNINIYDKKDRKGSASERYVGDRSLESILAQNGIKISQNEETQRIYERLAALPQEVYDQLKPTDIEAILKGNKDLYSIASSFEYGFGVQILNNAEQKQVENARKKEWGKDYKEKEIALQMLSNKYDNAIALLQNYKDNQGLLNVGFWRENASDVLKELSNLVGYEADKRSFHYNLTDIIEHLQKTKHEYLPKLEKHVHSNNSEFAREFNNITGKPFNPSTVKVLEEAIENKNNQDIEKWSDACFGNSLDKYIEKTLSMTQGIDGAGDIAVMLVGAEFMGAGVMANFGKGLTKLAAVKGGKIMVPMLAGGTTLAAWTGFQGSVNAVTKKAPTTTQDLKNIGIASLESFGFGAFGGLVQQVAVAPLMKVIDKPAKQALQSVATKLELNGQMSMADVVKTTMKVSTQDPSFIAKTAGFVTEVGGFTVYDMVEEIAKDLCTKNGNLPENMTLEDVTKYVGEKFAGQLNNLGGIKFMSNMFMMLKGGRIGQQAVINATLENAKELDNIKIKPITIDGKKQFEISTPDNKKMVVETVDDLVTTSQVLLQLQFIKNAKTETQALPVDGLKNRINQKINEIDIRTQKIDQKYRDAAKSIKDAGTPLEMFDIIDATPEELAKYVKEHTQKVVDHKGNVSEYIGDAMYTKEQFYEKINHLRIMREFLDTQSTAKQITVTRLDSYSIMEQIEINGQKLSAIMQNAVKNNNVEEVLAILNESDIDVNYKNFISTTTNPDFEWYGATIQWEVNVPKGSKGAQLKALVEEQIPSEKEFLLQAGSTFKIKHAEFKDGIWHIKADLVQETKSEIKFDERDEFGLRKYPATPKLDECTQRYVWASPLAKEVKKPKYQAEVSAYLDRLLEVCEEVEPAKRNTIDLSDHILPDGTMIHIKPSMTIKLTYDEYGNTTKSEFSNDEIIFEVREPNGKIHIIPAIDKNNFEKAQKIYNYLITLDEVPERLNTWKIQDQFVEKLKAGEKPDVKQLTTSKAEAKRTTPTIEAKPTPPDYSPYEPKLLDVKSKDAFVTFDKYNSVLKPEVEAELRNIAADIHNNAINAEAEIVDMMERNGLTPDGYEISHRAKSEQSIYDKLKNYLIENYEKNGSVTVKNAIKDVQDAVGVRTIIKAKDYTNDPQVQALLKAGKRKKAIALATQLQTAEMYKNLKTMMKALKADGVKDFGVVRISNYVSEKGVPYFSQRLLNRLKKIVDIGYENKEEPEYKKMLEDSGLEAPPKDYNVKKKSAGYTAFQANFKTKSGFVFEWQCRGKEINEFAEAEHIQYDVFSGKDIIKGDKHNERILRPTVDLMNPNTIPPKTVEYLNIYKSKYYEYLREKELGFKDAVKPEFDSKHYDVQLSAENLIKMHNTLDEINKIKKDATKTEIQKEKEIEETITDYESWLNNFKKQATMR